MKRLIVTCLAILILTGFSKDRSKAIVTGLTCTLKSDKTVFKIGELPKLTVEILNSTGKDIYLIGSLDHSDQARRMPYCYFTIQKPKPDTVQFGRCGFMNPLRIEDFVLVKNGEGFNPYQSIDQYGFFTDNHITRTETFKNSGIYKLRFHYSTKSDEISKFLFDPRYRSSNADSLKIALLFDKVPKVDIVSNEIELFFEE